VRPLHPHLNVRQPARMAEPARSVAQPMPMPQPMINPVHATMDALADQIGAEKSPAEDYILGGEDAPEVQAEPVPLTAKYPATEIRRPLNEQPLAPRAEPEKKAGWSIFGRKKAPADMRAEPSSDSRGPEPRTAAPRATAQPMPPLPQAQSEAQRNNDDLFPDHKRDEQFEIPAFLRRQSN
jgi:hypothetical protein